MSSSGDEKCHSCNLVNWNIWIIPSCQHRICSNCLLDSKGFTKCDTCYEAIFVECINANEGCAVIVRRNNPNLLNNHPRRCEFRKMSCPNNCTDRIASQNLVNHVKNDCPKRLLQCIHCLSNFFAEEIDEHSILCRSVAAKNAFAPAEDSSRGESEVHLEECSSAERLCEWSVLGCDFIGTSAEFERHHILCRHGRFFEGFAGKWEEKFTLFKEEMKSLRYEVITSRGNYNASETKVEELKNTVRKLEKENAALRQDIMIVKRNTEGIKDEVNGLNEKFEACAIGAAVTVNDEIQSEKREKLNASSRDLEHGNEAEEGLVYSIRKRKNIENLDNVVKNIQREIKILEESHTLSEVRIESLLSVMRDLQKEIVDLKGRATVAENGNQMMKNEIKSLDKSLRVMQTIGENESLKLKLNAALDGIDSMKTVNEEFKRRLEAQETETEEKQNELLNFSKELQKKLLAGLEKMDSSENLKSDPLLSSLKLFMKWAVGMRHLQLVFISNEQIYLKSVKEGELWFAIGPIKLPEFQNILNLRIMEIYLFTYTFIVGPTCEATDKEITSSHDSVQLVVRFKFRVRREETEIYADILHSKVQAVRLLFENNSTKEEILTADLRDLLTRIKEVPIFCGCIPSVNALQSKDVFATVKFFPYEENSIGQ